MRVSELSQVTGVPVATIKYYLREGLLPPGTPTSATSAAYDERHVERLGLVRALVEVGRLPIARVRAVVEALERPPTSWHDLLGAAHGALPAAGADTGGSAGSGGWGGSAGSGDSGGSGGSHDSGRSGGSGEDGGQPAGGIGAALTAVRALGWRVHPETAALRELQRALDAVAAVGLPMTREHLATYAAAAAAVAEADVASVPTDSPERAARHVVVGTVLHEPVLLALRRLAQQDASARRFGDRRP
jgi:DNA-binding transcriptional MerR regulator